MFWEAKAPKKYVYNNEEEKMRTKEYNLSGTETSLRKEENFLCICVYSSHEKNNLEKERKAKKNVQKGDILGFHVMRLYFFPRSSNQ